MQPTDDQFDQELSSLARETRRVAESIADPALRSRLIEIANEMLALAFPDRTHS